MFQGQRLIANFELRYDPKSVSPFKRKVPSVSASISTLHILSSPTEMQNFGKGSVNLELLRVGGLNSWQGLKLNIHFP